MRIIKAKTTAELEKELKFFDLKNSVFIYPTETAYGLGAIANDKKLIQKIYKLKERNPNKVLALIASDLEMIEKYFFISEEERILINKYWPGPLTLLLKVKKEDVFPKELFGLDNRIGIRVSSNAIAQYLSKLVNFPIIATSANLSGRGNSYSLQDLMRNFEKEQLDNIDFCIDAGDLGNNESSTVILVKKNDIIVLREGSIKIQK